MARRRITQECFQALREACGDAALSYCTVALWVKRFREGWDAVQDDLRKVRPHAENNTVQLLPCRILNSDELRVSWERKSENVTKLCSTFCTTFWVTANCSALDTSGNFRGATMIPLYSCTGLVGPEPKGRWRFPWTNRRYGRHLGSLIRTKVETAIKLMEGSRFLLVQRKSTLNSVLLRWCSLWRMTFMG